MKDFFLEVEDLSFVTLYGSQLGQAKYLSEGLVDKSKEYNLTTKVYPFDEIEDITDLNKIKSPLVIITSTTGDGEAPENAEKFFKKLKKRTLTGPILSSVKYTILGLGDTNFNNFNNCGKTIHKRLKDLGATTFLEPSWADDAIGQEPVIENWFKNIWPSLLKELNLEYILENMSTEKKGKKASDGLSLPNCPTVNLKIEYEEKIHETPIDLKNPPSLYPLIDGIPKTAKIINAKMLTKPGALKTTLELTIEFNDNQEFEFEPGDAIGIICPNDPQEISLLFERLKIVKINQAINLSSIKGKIPVHVPEKTSIKESFLYYCDIRATPKKAFLRLLAEYCQNDEDKNKLLELSSRQGSNLYNDKIVQPKLTILDILLEFPSCHPPVEALIEYLPRLIPRYYSICSSPLSSNKILKIAFNIVKFTKEEGRHYERFGICTGWLSKLASKYLNDSCEHLTELISKLDINIEDSAIIELYKRKNNVFRLPTNLSSPIIMIGPGTGIAPFLGFIEHKILQKSSVEMNLYFGCRNKILDFLYEEELNEFSKDDSIKIYTVFSRDPDNEGMKYVQDMLEKNKNVVIEALLDNNGYFYVCGDAKNMAKDVRNRLIKCIQDVKEINETEAELKIKTLVADKRYLQDIWT